MFMFKKQGNLDQMFLPFVMHVMTKTLLPHQAQLAVQESGCAKSPSELHQL